MIMVFRRRVARRGRKRVGKRVGRRLFRRRRHAVLSVRRMPSLLPDRLRVPLVVSEEVALTSSSGSLAYRQLTGNDAYDPDPVFGSSLEPAMFQEYAAMYGQQVCRGSSFEVQWNEVLTSNLYLGIAWALVPTPNALSGLTSVAQARELKYARSGISTQYRGTNRLRAYMSTAKIFGQRPSVITTESDYQSTVASSPVDKWYWWFLVQSADQASTVQVICWIRMKMYVEFWDPKSKTT